jgi:hypothetical protein
MPKPQLSDPSLALRPGSKARHPGVVVTYAVTPSDAQIAEYYVQLSNGNSWAPARAISESKVDVTSAGTRQMRTKVPVSEKRVMSAVADARRRLGG